MKAEPALSTVRANVPSLSFRRLLPALLALLVPAAIVISVTATGCSDQPEGERCDTRADRSGSDDCQAGLTCVPFSDLGGSGSICDGVTTCGVCCPDDRSQATTDVCALSTTLVGADASAPIVTDSGDAAAVTTDASDSGDSSSESDASDASDAAPILDASDAG